MAEAKKKDIEFHARINENCNRKLNDIMAVHGWNSSAAFEYAVIELHKQMVRDGYIPARYDNEIYDDYAVRGVMALTAAVKGKNIDM